MTDSSIPVEKAAAADLDRIEALLKANDLPARDVRTKPECFLVAVSDSELVAAGGIETNGSVGLLRSVVTRKSVRDRGYGTAVCDALEDHARENGVETVYLLTTTAAAFFRRRGYGAIAREEAPTSIQRTTEFTDLCPTSATCLRKRLG